jgi:hypothetical protein
MDAVVNAYHWRAEWTDPSGTSIVSHDWASTRIALQQLSNWIQAAVAKGSPADVMDACNAIIAWGGDRNRKVGASAFLGGIHNLPGYLNLVARQLSLASADITNFVNVQEMNAMLTKIHSLNAVDGLPIYDSRVAAATASLVEIYRQSLSSPWKTIPRELLFKAADRSHRRRVLGLDQSRLGFMRPIIDPGVIGRSTSPTGICKRAQEWSSAKVRLGWLLEQILRRANAKGRPIFKGGTPLNHSMPAKMHALEAGLFMAGFDVACFR